MNAQSASGSSGVAQRVDRRAYHLETVISVVPSEAAKRAVAEAYRIYDAFAPATFGALHDFVPGLGFNESSVDLAAGQVAFRYLSTEFTCG